MMNLKKTILITGATGGIGAALALQLLEEGHKVYMPVRNLQKAQKLFGVFQNAFFEIRNLEDFDDMVEYFLLQQREEVSFDVAVLLAGDLRKDSTFPGSTKEEQEAHSMEYHYRANVLTAETVLFGLKKVYEEALLQTSVIGVSSWISETEPGHPYRIDEEGYVQNKAKLNELLGFWQKEGVFKKVLCEKPGLIRSPLTEREFPELIADAMVPKLESSEYAAQLKTLITTL